MEKIEAVLVGGPYDGYLLNVVPCSNIILDGGVQNLSYRGTVEIIDDRRVYRFEAAS